MPSMLLFALLAAALPPADVALKSDETGYFDPYADWVDGHLVAMGAAGVASAVLGAGGVVAAGAVFVFAADRVPAALPIVTASAGAFLVVTGLIFAAASVPLFILQRMKLKRWDEVLLLATCTPCSLYLLLLFIPPWCVVTGPIGLMLGAIALIAGNQVRHVEEEARRRRLEEGVTSRSPS